MSLGSYQLALNQLKNKLLIRSPGIGFVGPYLTTERPLPERKVSNNVEAFVELYDKINKQDETVSPKKVSKSSKNDKTHISKRKKKTKRKKEQNEIKEEGLEEIKLVKVLIAQSYNR